MKCIYITMEKLIENNLKISCYNIEYLEWIQWNCSNFYDYDTDHYGKLSYEEY